MSGQLPRLIGVRLCLSCLFLKSSANFPRFSLSLFSSISKVHLCLFLILIPQTLPFFLSIFVVAFLFIWLIFSFCSSFCWLLCWLSFGILCTSPVSCMLFDPGNIVLHSCINSFKIFLLKILTCHLYRLEKEERAQSPKKKYLSKVL